MNRHAVAACVVIVFALAAAGCGGSSNKSSSSSSTTAVTATPRTSPKPKTSGSTSSSPSPTNSQTGTSSTATSQTATSSPHAPGPSTPATAASSRCHTADLKLGVHGAGAGMGHLNSIVVLTNASQRTCTVYGYAGFQLVGANGADLPTHVVRGSTFFQTDPGPHPISLPPGQSAWADLATTDVAAPGENPTQCEPPAARLEVTPPDETTQLVAAFAAVACDHGRLDTTAFSQGAGPAA